MGMWGAIGSRKLQLQKCEECYGKTKYERNSGRSYSNMAAGISTDFAEHRVI